MTPPISMFSTTIAKSGDGLHAFAYSQFDSSWQMRVWLRVWRKDDFSDLRLVRLVGLDYLGGAQIVFIGNRLVYADDDRAGRIRVLEFEVNESASEWAIASEHTFGDGTAQSPCICKTDSGGAVIIAYSHDNTVNLWVGYLKPGVPSLTSTGRFWSDHFVFTGDGGGLPPLTYAMVTNAVGEIEVYIVRDGSHTVQLAKFKEIVGDKLEEVYFNGSFFNDEQYKDYQNDIFRLVMGDVAPDCELPGIFAIRDRKNARTLLSYQHSRWAGYITRCNTLHVPVTIVAVYHDLHYSAIFKTGRVTEGTGTGTPDNPGKYEGVIINRSEVQRSPIFVHEQGIECLARPHEEDCKTYWRQVSYVAKDKSVLVSPDRLQVPDANAWIAVSEDGFVAVREMDNQVTLSKIFIPQTDAKLVIERIDSSPRQVKVTWPGKDWILEASENLKDWSDVAGAASPYFESMDLTKHNQKYFRLRKQS